MATPFTVVGVAPKGFIGTEVAFTPEMWIPMMMAGVIEPGSKWLERRTSDNLFVVGRLKPGVSDAQARAELETITAQLGKDYPENAGRGLLLGKPGLFLPEIRNAVFGFAGILTVSRRARPAARLRESRQPAPGARHRAPQGNRGPARDWRQPQPAR